MSYTNWYQGGNRDNFLIARFGSGKRDWYKLYLFWYAHYFIEIDKLDDRILFENYDSEYITNNWCLEEQ
jgi:hypothetical protein